MAKEVIEKAAKEEDIFEKKNNTVIAVVGDGTKKNPIKKKFAKKVVKKP
jgi:hypothetical protein